MNNSLFSEKLGLYGWNNLEPIILASLTLESPLLLIGKHGSAKSFLIEKLSKQLNKEYRFYNASLINYDDLVGIPLPNEDKTGLKYISSPNSIWDAETIFIDEINRTKPELQNKLFPIIYDKRVQGIDLPKLKYRFAAMNPPIFEDNDDDIDYLGTTLLDPALADRFMFIIDAPCWDNLSEEEQSLMLLDSFNGEYQLDINIKDVLNAIKLEYLKQRKLLANMLSQFIIALTNLINSKVGYISSRRATMLINAIVAVHSARIIIERYNDSQDQIDIKESIMLCVLNALPLKATMKIDNIKIIVLVKQAYALSCSTNTIYKRIASMNDPQKILIETVNNHNSLQSEQINELICANLGNLNFIDKRVFSYLAFSKLKKVKNLPATLIEVLSSEIVTILRVNSSLVPLHQSYKTNYDYIINFNLDKKKYNKKTRNLLRNIMFSFIEHPEFDENTCSDILHSYDYFSESLFAQ